MLPDGFRHLAYSCGWCAKSVDSLADRLVFDGFSDDGLFLGELYSLNNPDILPDSAILSALISSCSFISIGMTDRLPSMQVIDGGSATGIIDPVTNMLTEGYAVLERDKHKRPIREAYYLPKRTVYYENGVMSDEFTHDAPFALLVPVINRPDAKRPFGHSRITRSCMSIVQGVLRTLRRSEVSAEFYSFPQKYVLGLSPEAEFSSRAATVSSFLSFGKDEDGDRPAVGQFEQQSMNPYAEQLRSYASMFAGETGLTLDDLGFSTGNPASYDAIRASHESLRLTARKAQRTFGVGLINAGFLAACVRDKREYDRYALAQTSVQWMPVFEPDASALGVIGDAILKLSQSVPDFDTKATLKALTGL